MSSEHTSFTGDGMEEPTTQEIVQEFFDEIEAIWAQITDDDSLSDIQKAELIQVFEEIEQHHDYVKEIFGVSSEND